MSKENVNFYMMPGDPMKKLDTPGGFSYKAESTMNKLGMGPINDGHSPVNRNPQINKDEVKNEEKKKEKKEDDRPLNPFSDKYTGVFEGDNPYIRFGGQQKSMSGTIFKN